jgi:hypothetical protein
VTSRLGIGFGQALALASLLSCATAVRADNMDGYRFEAAAQEITQLFWLAETAAACGWTSHEDAMRFKHFSVRFLAAHLSDMHKMALVSLVTETGYEDKVRRAALEGAQHNCDSSRWHTGWVAYKAAADQRDRDF